MFTDVGIRTSIILVEDACGIRVDVGPSVHQVFNHFPVVSEGSGLNGRSELSTLYMDVRTVLDESFNNIQMAIVYSRLEYSPVVPSLG